MKMTSEQERLAFLEARDGKEATRAWAIRTLTLYKSARKTPYGKAYRRTLVESLADLRAYSRKEP